MVKMIIFKIKPNFKKIDFEDKFFKNYLKKINIKIIY